MPMSAAATTPPAARSPPALSRIGPPCWPSGGLLIADQPIEAEGLEPLPLPEGAPGRYFISRRVKR